MSNIKTPNLNIYLVKTRGKPKTKKFLKHVDEFRKSEPFYNCKTKEEVQETYKNLISPYESYGDLGKALIKDLNKASLLRIRELEEKKMNNTPKIDKDGIELIKQLSNELGGFDKVGELMRGLNFGNNIPNIEQFSNTSNPTQSPVDVVEKELDFQLKGLTDEQTISVFRYILNEFEEETGFSKCLMELAGL